MRWNSCIFKPAYWTAINNSQDQPKSTGMTTVFKAYVITTQNSIGNIESKMQNNKVDKQAKKGYLVCELALILLFVSCFMSLKGRYQSIFLSLFYSLQFSTIKSHESSAAIEVNDSHGVCCWKVQSCLAPWTPKLQQKIGYHKTSFTVKMTLSQQFLSSLLSKQIVATAALPVTESEDCHRSRGT